MVAIYPPVDVQDPTIHTARYGLFTAATGPLDLPAHAIGGGVRYRAVHTDLPEGFEVTCAAESVTFPDPCGDWITGTPFAIQATLTSGTVGMPQDEIERILRQRLIDGEQAIAENIFSLGTFGQAPSLANNVPAATVLTAASNVIDGIGVLEEWLAARSGIRGVIHVPAVLSPRVSRDLGVKEGQRWVTTLGNTISVGNYAGQSPAGVAPAAGHTWIYITGSTTVWRTPDRDMFVSPYEGNVDFGKFDRTPAMGNQVTALARREYVIAHDGLLAAVDVTIGGAS